MPEIIVILGSIVVAAIVLLIVYKVLSLWFDGVILQTIGMLIGLLFLIYILSLFGLAPTTWR